MVQGPLPDDLGSFIVAGRYSYTAALLSAISSNINLAYWDYQARVKLRDTPRDSLTVFAFGARDYLGTSTNVPCSPEMPSDLHRRCGDRASSCTALQSLFDTTFHRLDLRYDHRFGGPEDRIREAVTLGYDKTSFAADAYVDDYLFSARSEITKRATEGVLLRAGVDLQRSTPTGRLSAADRPSSGDNGFTLALPQPHRDRHRRARRRRDRDHASLRGDAGGPARRPRSCT